MSSIDAARVPLDLRLHERLAALEEGAKNLKGGQENQHDAIRRVEDKVDSLRVWIMTELAAFAFSAVGVVIALLWKK